MAIKRVSVIHLGILGIHDRDERWIKFGTTEMPELPTRAFILACSLFDKYDFTDPDEFWLFLQYLLNTYWYIFSRESQRFSQCTNRHCSSFRHSPVKLQLRI